MADGAGRDGGSGKRKTESLEQLSEDLVRNILARLAPEELVRAQLVCKEWKRLVRAQRPRQGEPWLLFTRTLTCNVVQMFGSRWPLAEWKIPAEEFPHCWAYDPARDRFFKVELPASMELQDLHSRGASMKLRHLRFCGSTPGSGVVAFLERGGFRELADPALPWPPMGWPPSWEAAEAEKDPSPLAMLWIGNPLLRGSWRRVPCLDTARFTDVVVGRAGSFKVVRHRQSNGPKWQLGLWRTRVFDSVTGRETDAAPIRSSVPSSNSLRCEDSCVGEGGLVYYLKAGWQFDGELPVAEVMSYSVEKDEWSVVAPATPLSHPKGRPSPGSLRIFEHQGAVKLSAGIPLLDFDKWGRAVNWSHLLNIFGFYSYDAGTQGWVWDQASEVCLPDHFLEAEFRDMKQIQVGGGGGNGSGHVQLLCFKDGRKLFHPGMDLFKYQASSKRWSLQRSASYPMYPRRTHFFWEDAFLAFHPSLDSDCESE